MTHSAEELAALRKEMVNRQIKARGIRDPGVLRAMGEVPREAFVPEDLHGLAYSDGALPIAEDQTISQPYIVALMAEAAELGPEDRVLDVGTGSGYAAAVMAEIGEHVFTIERIERLSKSARAALARAGIGNVTFRVGDGTLGWPEEAPFDAIVVAAGAPAAPSTLKRQLSIGGRLVIPVQSGAYQTLTRIRRVGEEDFREENLGAVQFVPLIGEEGWRDKSRRETWSRRNMSEDEIPGAIAKAAEPLPAPGNAEFGAAFDRLGTGSVVGLGEATHGTAEFYDARAAITKRLVEHHGFTIIALEADWPDAARLDRYVRHREAPPWDEPAFTRFPTWMWRNEEAQALMDWLRDFNMDRPPERRVSVHGLDLYALNTSIGAVTAYLDDVDPDLAAVARRRYGCLSPWQKDPVSYGYATRHDGWEQCESAVAAMLRELMEKRAELIEKDGDDYLDAEGNARLIASAEHYYRSMFHGGENSWNLRDTHMVQTLDRVRAARGNAKAVIWAHNSHIGDASATEMGIHRGQVNIGSLCRERYGREVLLLGFGTDRGTVAAASDWDGEMEFKRVRPALPDSVEALCRDSGEGRFLLDLARERSRESPLDHALLGPRLQRAIGVIYRPETERLSHYFETSVPRQFDHYVWFETTNPVAPLTVEPGRRPGETYPFGL